MAHPIASFRPCSRYSVMAAFRGSSVRTRKTERRPAARGPEAAVRRASDSGEAQCARMRDDTQVSISDCSQATARLDSLIGTGNWFCEMSL